MTVDEHKPVPADAACVAYGYELRGLSRDGVCPECGASIERSLQASLLRFADQEWLRGVEVAVVRQHRAMQWMFAAALGAVGAGFLADYTSMLILGSGVVLILAIVTAANVQTIGLMPVALPGPGRARHRARMMLRVSAIVHVAGVLIGLAVASSPMPRSGAWPYVGAAFHLNGAVMLVALLMVLEDIERRTSWWTSERVSLYLACLLGVVVVGLVSVGASVDAILAGSIGGWRGGLTTFALLMLTGLVGRVRDAVEHERVEGGKVQFDGEQRGSGATSGVSVRSAGNVLRNQLFRSTAFGGMRGRLDGSP